MGRPSTLSVPAQELVLAALRESKQPLGAYHILEKVKSYGINSPQIIYRSLSALMHTGAVHRIKEFGTFMACNCSSDHDHTLSILTVCQNCKKVSELHNHIIIDHIIKLRALNVNITKHAIIELPITCDVCVA